jgi:hypothetical protein
MLLNPFNSLIDLEFKAKNVYFVYDFVSKTNSMKLKKIFSFAILILSANFLRGQNCNGNHSNTFLSLANQNGVEISYRINHCNNGDEVLMQIVNSNSISVNVSFVPKISSANQVWMQATASSIVIQPQTTLVSPTTCNLVNAEVEFVGKEIFPDEYFPTNNAYPQILSFELLNIIIN